MRSDVYIDEVLSHYDALKRAGLIPPEPKMRPRAWIKNFDDEDKLIAAKLLERFIYYDQRLTESLLKASFFSIADGLSKGPQAPSKQQLLQSLPSAIFTPVSGESPNATDSGYLFCRLVRQTLGVSESNILLNDKAREKAKEGATVIFVDDFIGSGDQFISTWQSNDSSLQSFQSIQKRTNFQAIYVCLIGIKEGIQAIQSRVPSIAICVTHKIDKRSTLWGIRDANPELYSQFNALLNKYSTRLQPSENYMTQNHYLLYGYKNKGLFLGFQHSIPDATLPIFWCRGTNNWEPLIERS